MPYQHITLESVWQWPASLAEAPLVVIDARVHLVRIMQHAHATFGSGVKFSTPFMRQWLKAKWACFLNDPIRVLPKPSTGYRILIVDDWRCENSDKNYWRNDYLLARGFEPYKGNRDITRSEAYSILHDTLLEYANSARSGFKVFREQGFEADDFVGAIAKLKLSGVASKRFCLLYTCDHDHLQLVNDSTNLLWLNAFQHKPLLRNEAEHLLYMFERKGVVHYSPRDLVDYKATYGDAGDNLAPGSPRECIDLLEPAVQLPDFAVQMLKQELDSPESNTNAQHGEAACKWLDDINGVYR